jgi:hypothetical protein
VRTSTLDLIFYLKLKMRNIDHIINQKEDGVLELLRWVTTCTECPHYEECNSTSPSDCYHELINYLFKERKNNEEED